MDSLFFQIFLWVVCCLERKSVGSVFCCKMSFLKGDGISFDVFFWSRKEVCMPLTFVNLEREWPDVNRE